MKHFIYIAFLSIFICLTITSCVKEKNFPSKPVIEFQKFVLYNNDSADCTIKFKDGDGDIGVYKGDTSSEDNLKMKAGVGFYFLPGNWFVVKISRCCNHRRVIDGQTRTSGYHLTSKRALHFFAQALICRNPAS